MAGAPPRYAWPLRSLHAIKGRAGQMGYPA